MRIAYVHILPIEYYPPATNTLKLLAARKSWEVRSWTSPNHRNLPEWSNDDVHVVRHTYLQQYRSAPQRLASYLGWHLAAARELTKWKPEVIISVEPHSAIAVWTYFNIFGGRARLFIHHHEYYAPRDFAARGMRLARIGARLESRNLFPRAEWISQTNADRLEMIARDAHLDFRALRVLPNYPPREWSERAFRNARNDSPLRKLIYLGSASLEDTFIAEAANWVARRPQQVSLTVVGNNIAGDVWSTLAAMRAPNISLNTGGRDYEMLPEMLKQFDVGLILYKGNTQNFIYNIPNKAIEYLASGLEVWYPPQMRSMQAMRFTVPELPITEVNFESMPETIPEGRGTLSSDLREHFTAEAALRPLIEQIDSGASRE